MHSLYREDLKADAAAINVRIEAASSEAGTHPAAAADPAQSTPPPRHAALQGQLLPNPAVHEGKEDVSPQVTEIVSPCSQSEICFTSYARFVLFRHGTY